MKVILTSQSATLDGASICGQAAAVCTASGNPAKSLRAALKSGHESVLEHVSFTFRIEGLSSGRAGALTSWHRLASFDVESQRYVAGRCAHGGCAGLYCPDLNSSRKRKCLTGSMKFYKRLVAGGIPPEDARYVTPQAVVTNLLMTMNVRELRHFFRLRCCNRAQWEIRGVADAMLAICKKVVPELFYGAGPSCVSCGCMEACPCGHRRNEHDWDILPEQAVIAYEDSCS